MTIKTISPALVLALCLSVSPVHAMVQEQPEVPRPSDNFAAKFLKDHASLWASPVKIKRGDVKWLLPLSAGAAALVASGADWGVSQDLRNTESIRPASRFLSKFGGGAPMMGASGAIFAFGRLTGNNKAAETGLLASQAVLHSQLLVGGIKLLVNRERPNKVDGQGQFFGGGRSFPSGHAATTFAFAAVVSDRYKSPWVKIGVYSLATGVSLSRIGGLNHFPSDVLIGATIGHLIGRYILRQHSSEIQ